MALNLKMFKTLGTMTVVTPPSMMNPDNLTFTTNTNTNQLTTFQWEDTAGTEVTISHAKAIQELSAEVKELKKQING